MTIGIHAQRLGIPTYSHCPLCKREDTILNSEHLLCQCDALARNRLKHLNLPNISNKKEICEVN